MATKKTTPTRKSTKKSPSKKAPRRSPAKAAPPPVRDESGPEAVEYCFRGTIYQLQKDDAGFHFGDLTFKTKYEFGRHLAKLHDEPEPAVETDPLPAHVETTLAKKPRRRSKAQKAAGDASEPAEVEAAPDAERVAKRPRKAAAGSKDRKTSPDPRLAPGTTLSRMYKGQEIKVTVQDDGTFLYDGQTFKSISAVAKHIVGYMISGPVFFRLVEPKPAAAKDGQ